MKKTKATEKRIVVGSGEYIIKGENQADVKKKVIKSNHSTAMRLYLLPPKKFKKLPIPRRPRLPH